MESPSIMCNVYLWGTDVNINYFHLADLTIPQTLTNSITVNTLEISIQQSSVPMEQQGEMMWSLYYCQVYLCSDKGEDDEISRLLWSLHLKRQERSLCPRSLYFCQVYLRSDGRDY